MEADRPVAPARRTRVAAYAVCVDDVDRILLCRVGPSDPVAAGHWTLPGGGVRFGEDPAAAALRELGEETGLSGLVTAVMDVHSRVRRPIRGYDAASLHAVSILFRVRAADGPLRDETGGSTDRAAWHSLASVAALPLVDLARHAISLLPGTLAGHAPLPSGR